MGIKSKGMLIAALGATCLAQAAIKEVEWVQFSDQHWINTYYVPSCTDTFEIRARLSKTDVTQAFWCSRTELAKDTMTLFLLSGKLRFDRNTNTATTSSTSIAAETDYTVVANYATGKATVNGTDAGITMATGDFSCSMPVILGASAMNYTSIGNYNTGRLYGFKVSNAEGTVLHNFVPAYDDDRSLYGLYDTIAKRFSRVCGPGASTGAAVAAEATEFSSEEWTDHTVINVPENEERTLTADDVAGFDSKPLVKLGKGRLNVGAEMKDFAGDIFIREGVYRATNAGSFGTDAGRTYVVGGTLLSTVAAANTWTSDGGVAAFGTERFYISGAGHEGLGAVCQQEKGCSNFSGQGRMTFEGDATIGGTQTLEFRYGTVDMNNCRLTSARENNSLFRLVALGVNACGPIDVEKGKFGLEGGTGNPGATTTITVRKDTTLSVNNTTQADNRKIVFEEGARFEIGGQAASITPGALTDNNRWNGAISLADVVPLTFAARGRPFNVGAVVSGNGGFAAKGGGYLQLGATNTFLGGVSVEGVTAAGDLNVTGGVTIARASGAAVVPPRVLRADGGAITIKNAQLTMAGEDRAIAFPDLVAKEKAVVTGQVTAVSFKSLTKEGTGPLTVFGGAKILGATTMANGTLRFGTSVPAAPSGLNWYYYQGNVGSHQTANPPATVPYMGVDPTGASYAYKDWLSSSGANSAPVHQQCHYYTGWIKVPGEEGTSVDCNFIVCICRNVSVVIDDEYVAKVSDNKDDLTGRTLNYKRCVVCPKKTLTAGWHKILIYMGNFYNGDAGPKSCTNPVWGSNFGIGVDWQGRCEAVTDNYVKLQDPGDGSFLRPQDPALGKAALDATAYRPTFGGAVAFGPGATLDVNDTAPYTPVVIPELKGLPTIANGEVHVTGATWTVRVDDFATGGNGLTLSANAKLVFAAGTKLAFEGDFDDLSHTGDLKTRRIVNTGAGTIENLPQLSGRVGESNWYLQPSKDGQGYDLAYIRSLAIIIR